MLLVKKQFMSRPGRNAVSGSRRRMFCLTDTNRNKFTESWKNKDTDHQHELTQYPEKLVLVENKRLSPNPHLLSVPGQECCYSTCTR